MTPIETPFVVGPYECVRPLAPPGGEASVFAARDLRVGADAVPTVAVRVLHIVDDRTWERAQREALVAGAAQACSAHVVDVLACAEHGAGAWIAMPLIEGVTLHDLHQGRPALDEDAFATILVQVASALATLHCLGQAVRHGDVKPANVIVETFEAPHATLVDLGCVVIGDEPGRRGSWPYTAPQVMAGEVPDLAGRDDVYALGMTAAFMLTGRAPALGADGAIDLGDAPLGARYADLLTRATADRREDRPTARELAEAIARRAWPPTVPARIGALLRAPAVALERPPDAGDVSVPDGLDPSLRAVIDAAGGNGRDHLLAARVLERYGFAKDAERTSATGSPASTACA